MNYLRSSYRFFVPNFLFPFIVLCFSIISLAITLHILLFNISCIRIFVWMTCTFSDDFYSKYIFFAFSSITSFISRLISSAFIRTVLFIISDIQWTFSIFALKHILSLLLLISSFKRQSNTKFALNL